MKTTRQSLSIIVTALLLALCFSCKDDDTQAVCNGNDFAIANTTGAFPANTTYIQILGDLNITALENNNAAETPKSAFIWKYDDTGIYTTSFGAPATMVKYKLDENCIPREGEKMVVPGANTFSAVEFISPTKAYASVGGGLAKVVIFDPSTLRVTGEIDLAKTKRDGAPEMYYIGTAVRDNKFFLALSYFDANFNEAYDSAMIAVIDIATDKVEKVIRDNRTGHIFPNGAALEAFAMDANGDLYVQGLGYTHVASGRDVPSGILRIKNGQTDFDPDYFFNLKEATGKNCYGLYHFGDGQTFTTRIEDPSKFWSAPSCKFYKLNLNSKTSLGELSGVPAVQSSSTAWMRKFDNERILFAVAGATENAVYEYNIASGTASKKFTTVGKSFGFEKKE